MAYIWLCQNVHLVVLEMQAAKSADTLAQCSMLYRTFIQSKRRVSEEMPESDFIYICPRVRLVAAFALRCPMPCHADAHYASALDLGRGGGYLACGGHTIQRCQLTRCDAWTTRIWKFRTTKEAYTRCHSFSERTDKDGRYTFNDDMDVSFTDRSIQLISFA